MLDKQPASSTAGKFVFWSSKSNAVCALNIIIVTIFFGKITAAYVLTMTKLRLITSLTSYIKLLSAN